jgi:glycosyltransferase involved in cell wall biosynthesis
LAGNIKISTMVAVIIPTIYRESLGKAIRSVMEFNIVPIIESGGTAGENRNRGIQKTKNLKADWITFLDDDDYYKNIFNFSSAAEYDIVILRMQQGDKLVPDETGELKFGNVGINFALNMNRIKWEDIPEFDSNGEGEDWRFLEQLLQKYNKVKITNDIYYVAPKRSYNQ